MARNTIASLPSSSRSSSLASDARRIAVRSALVSVGLATAVGCAGLQRGANTAPTPWADAETRAPLAGAFSDLESPGVPSSELPPQVALHAALEAANAATTAVNSADAERFDELDSYGANLDTDPMTEAWLRVDEAVLFGRIAAEPTPEAVTVSVDTQRRALAGNIPPGELHLYVPGTGERLQVRVFDYAGRMRPEAVREISWALRSRRADRARTIEPRLITMLYLVGQHYDAELQVVSGYRVRGEDASQGSRHGSGRACDFDIRGVGTRTLANHLDATFAQAGIGYYPTSGFVHLDVRDSSYYWIDRSGSGQRSRTRTRTPRTRASEADDPTLRSFHVTEAELYVPPPFED